jgi:hypothetical protein
VKIKKSGPDDLKKAVDAGTVGLVAIASSVNVGLGVAVGMAAALFGPAIERRRDRAEQLIKFVHDNIGGISAAVLEDKVFQDGFVFLLEKYIRERNDDKRLILQQILLGYINVPSLLDYPLEEMSELVARIRMSDVEVFRQALREEAKQGIKQDGRRFSYMLREDPNAVSRLIYFGLLHEDRAKNGPQIREYDDKNFLYIWITPTGRQFAEYLGMPALKPAITHPVYYD